MYIPNRVSKQTMHIMLEMGGSEKCSRKEANEKNRGNQVAGMLLHILISVYMKIASRIFLCTISVKGIFLYMERIRHTLE